jgi:hypothetical protein
MEELQKLTVHLEYIFLKTIVRELKANHLKIPDAKMYATAFKKLEPFTSLDDAKTKMMQFAQMYQAYVLPEDYIDIYFQELKKDELIEQMREHLKNNNIDEAIKLVKVN